MKTNQVKNIKEQLQNIAQYLKTKVLKNDFEIIGMDEYKATLKIDDEFEVKIWIANYDYGIAFREIGKPLSPYLILTEKEKKQIWNLMKSHIENQKKKVLQEKMEQIQKQLKELK